MKVGVLLVFLIMLNSRSVAFYKPNVVGTLTSTGNVGYPSMVTDYIQEGKIEEALKNCSVPNMKEKTVSFAGFFTIVKNKMYDLNMFFWYFPSEEKETLVPVVLWLQGGPGVTSLVGVFEENGPFSVRKTHGLKIRKDSWVTKFNMLYVDNPIGTGFSFSTSQTEGYSTNEEDIAQNLLNTLLQFFTLFPDLKNNDFYIAGESYAGKYVPTLADVIDKHNHKLPLNKINLKGISIGNGFIDPPNMLSYGKYLYQIGLIDDKGLSKFEDKEKNVQKFVKYNDYIKAFEEFDELINGDTTPYKTLFYNLTKESDYMNYMTAGEESPFGDFSKYIQSDVARRTIHVGDMSFVPTSKKVEQYLKSDVMRSVKPIIEKLLETYRVLIYNGQFDIIVAYPLTVNSIKTMQWSGSRQYSIAKRYPFIVNNKIAGYYKKARNLIEVMVRNAGHMVPKDQPEWALELIRCFTYNDKTCFP